MIPLQLLRQSGINNQIIVDTKNGESFDGILLGIDSFMNVKLSDVIITSANGNFSKCNQCFIRGNNIKSIRFDSKIIEQH